MLRQDLSDDNHSASSIPSIFKDDILELEPTTILGIAICINQATYPTENTYPKNLAILQTRLSQERCDQLDDVFASMPESNVQVFQEFLGRLTDFEYRCVLENLRLSEPPRFKTYIEIYASYCTPPPKTVPFKCSLPTLQAQEVYEDHCLYMETDLESDGRVEYGNSEKNATTQYGTDNNDTEQHGAAYPSKDVHDSEQLESQHDYETYEDPEVQDSNQQSRAISADCYETPNPDKVCLEIDPSMIDTLVEMVLNLPPELYNMIVKDIIELSFHPGKIFPMWNPTCYGYHCLHGEHFQEPDPKILLALPAAVHPELRKRCWSGSTWMIGPGRGTTDFLRNMDESLHDLIRYVHAKFTLDDVCLGPILHENIRSELEYQSSTGEADSIEVLGRFKKMNDIFETQLGEIWHEKFDRISELDLTELTLDFTEAHAPDGTFIGLSEARLFEMFRHGLPHLNIQAPTRTLERQLHDLFAQNNPRLSRRREEGLDT